jgi:hypothetical protein
LGSVGTGRGRWELFFPFEARPAKPFFLFLGFRPEAKVCDSRETFSELLGLCRPELLSFRVGAGDELASDMTLGSVMVQVIGAILRSTVSFSIAGDIRLSRGNSASPRLCEVEGAKGNGILRAQISRECHPIHGQPPFSGQLAR